MTTVLEIKNLNKSFGGIRVADDINLSLSAGRVLGLIGPNGAGKTSLFNLAFGNVKPDSGSILLNGKVLDGMTPQQIERIAVHELCHILVNEMRESEMCHEERVVTMLTKAFLWVEAAAKETQP